MSARAAKILVMRDAGSACIRIIGRANFTSSVDFKALIEDLRQKGCNCFILDLSDCLLMDSTFLGLLAGLGLKLANAPEGQGVLLYRPSARILELLETLGVLHLFKTCEATAWPTAASDTTEMPASDASKTEVTRTCLEAHQTLMDISPENVSRFKDVTAFLAAGLKQTRPE